LTLALLALLALRPALDTGGPPTRADLTGSVPLRVFMDTSVCFSHL
jgi:hypothetical protein